MPELPEVETVVKILNKELINKQFFDVFVYWDNIIAYPSTDEFIENIKNETINEVSRRGKYILFHLTSKTLVSHLRMEGKYYIYDKEVKKDKHTHVIFKFSDDSYLHYHDTRKFGKMYLYDNSEELSILENVGLEPWDIKLTHTYLKNKANKRQVSIKAFLLDQSVIAGIGNIYVNEILYKAKIHPASKAKNLTYADYDKIIEATQLILEAAILAGGTTIKSYTSSLGVTGLFQQSLKVHNQADKECEICNSKIIKMTIAQRGTYLCPKCQIKK